MKFTLLDVESFGPIGQATLRLGDRGLILITGENLDDSSADSNGAGKSSLMEALCWCLYGTTAKGVSGDAVVNRVHSKGTKVVVELDDDGNLYRVTRFRKHRTGKNRVTLEVITDPSKVVDLTKGTDALTQVEIDRIMGASYEVFSAANYAGQERMPDLPAMTDKQLKLLIEEAAGITVLDMAHEIAKRERDDLDEACREIALKEQRVALQISALKDRLNDAIAARKTWASERAERIMEHEAEARRFAAAAESLKPKIAAVGSKAQLQEELDKVTAALAGLKGEQGELRRLETALRNEETNAARQRANADSAVRKLKEEQRVLANVRGEVGKPCGECGRVHDKESLASAIETLNDNVAIAAREAREAIDAAKSALASSEIARECVEKHRASMTDATHASALRAQFSASLAEIERLERERAQLLTRAKDRISSIRAEKAAENPYEEHVTRLSEEAKIAVANRKSIAESFKEADAKLKVAIDVVGVYGMSGVRAHILDTVTPYLNERTAHYLGVLSDGNISATWQTLSLTAKGELREKFSISVDHALGGSSFAQISGGEKRRVRLACAMALQDLVATRATKPIEFWSADEIDYALDVPGQERLMGLLEEKARERGSVFVISHNDLSDMIGQCVRVTKKDRLSEITEVTA